MCRVFARVASLLLIGCVPWLACRGRKVEGTDGTGGQANVTLCLRQGGDERGTLHVQVIRRAHGPIAPRYRVITTWTLGRDRVVITLVRSWWQR